MLKISIKTIEGKTIPIEVLKIEKISDVKRKIQRQIGMIPIELKLAFQGKILDDNKTIDYYQMDDKSVINIIGSLSNLFQISIKLEIKYENLTKELKERKFSIDVQKTDKIRNVKNMIEEKVGLASEKQRLIFQGEILNDEKTIGFYRLNEKSVIYVYPRLRGGVRSFSEKIDKKPIVITKDQIEKFRNLNTNFKDKTEFSPQKPTFNFDRKNKKCDMFDGNDKLSDESLIKGDSTWSIFAKVKNERWFSFEIHKREKIIEIKRKIENKMGLPSDEQILICQGYLLEDEKFVDQCDIKKNSVIHVYSRLKFEMEIRIKSKDEIIGSIHVNKTEIISSVKRKIQKKIGVEFYSLRLTFKGVPLENDKTIEEYQITDQSVIELITGMRNRIQIIVKMFDDKTFPIDVLTSATVGSIKSLIQQNIGMAPDEQILIFQDYLLEDERFLDECGIANQSVINIYER